jgi:valyl-tRNA synthetase
VLLTVLDRSLRLLHPVMPYLTEELWQRLPGREAVHPVSIAVAPFPQPVAAWADAEVEERVEAVQALITRARAMRAEQGVKGDTETTLYAHSEVPGLDDFLKEQEPLIRFLCRLTHLKLEPPPEGAGRDLVAGIEVSLEAEREELSAEERERLERDLAKIDGEVRGAEGRLSNEQFLAKAPPNVVEGNRKRLEELKERRQRILDSLEGA